MLAISLWLGSVLMGVASTDAPAPELTGFGLFQSQSADWAWQPVPVEGCVLSRNVDARGCVVLFSTPKAALGSPDVDKVRVGLTSGFAGARPAVRVSVASAYVPDPTQAPWEAKLFGQAVLQRARVYEEDNVLKIEAVFDTVPEFLSPWDFYLLLDTDGDGTNGFQGADYLVQNTALKATPDVPIRVAWFEVRPGIAKVGDPVEVAACIENCAKESVSIKDVRLALPKGIVLGGLSVTGPFELRAKEVRWFAWRLNSTAAGSFLLRLTMEGPGLTARASRWITAVAQPDPTHEFQAADGSWFAFPPRATLQAGNTAGLRPLQRRPSSELKHNLFGITAHLPRSTDGENPFAVSHLIDGDPATCWASRWWRVAVPFTPETIRLDLGAEKPLAELRFLPAWKNGGMPPAFTIEVSRDGNRWESVADETDFHPCEAPEGKPLRIGDLTWQRFPFVVCPARYVRLSASRLNQGHTGFFCAPMDPFQWRVAELALLGPEGKPLPLSDAKVDASSTHRAWYNTPETINKTWPLLLQSGVKLNRVGQWGDKTDWATVEKTKGVYHIDPEVDSAIDESTKAGVDILMTLDYGNNLYQQIKDPQEFGPTWHRGHPFLQCAPTTPEAVEAFARYCAFMAGHFRGRVKYFEIWNEENGWFFDAWAAGARLDMVRAYGRALAAAAKAIKAANPDALVVFGGTAGASLDYPRIALDEGAGANVDVFAFHPYGHPTPEGVPTTFLTAAGDNMEWKPKPANIRNYEEEIGAFRELLHRYNPRMQVWADEMNWFAPGEPAMVSMGDQSELTQAKHLARFYAINAWLGCGAVWWSLYNANGIQEWAVLRSGDLSPRAAYYSAGYVATLLDDVTGQNEPKPEVVGQAPPDLTVKMYRNGRGQTIAGLWRTSPGDDACHPAAVTLRLPVTAGAVMLADALYGFTQTAVTRPAEGCLEIPNLLVGDWPLFLLWEPDSASDLRPGQEKP
jgi:hypothetical protein